MTRPVAAMAILLCTVSLLEAQRFSSGVDAVRVDLLVTSDGRPVNGMIASDFDLFDNGVRQVIDAATVGDVPLSVTIALDISGSVVGDTLLRLKDAVRAALGAMTAVDRVALITFADEVRVRIPWTSSFEQIADRIDGLRAGGRTSLVDASFASLAFDDVPGRRRLVLLFTDGVDNASWLPRHAVLRRAEETEAVVYAVVAGEAAEHAEATLMYRSGVQLTNDALLRTPGAFPDELTATTGGRTLRRGGHNALRASFEEIIREFKSRYVLTYMPRGVDPGGWHAIEVKLKAGRGAVTARRGYLRQ